MARDIIRKETDTRAGKANLVFLYIAGGYLGGTGFIWLGDRVASYLVAAWKPGLASFVELTKQDVFGVLVLMLGCVLIVALRDVAGVWLHLRKTPR